ncbi:MAG: hypothetical protein WCW87_02425 [Candidatus Paceibacterota bacterium]
MTSPKQLSEDLLRKIRTFIKRNPKALPKELVKKFHGLTIGQAKDLLTPLNPEHELDLEIEKSRLSKEVGYNKKTLKLLQDRLEKAEKERDAVRRLKDEISCYKITRRSDSEESSATAVAVGSDWHIEERVDPSTVNDLNNSNLEITGKRATLFFQSLLRLIEAKQKSINIKTLILALLGDFISGSIHDELMEGNLLLPIDATLEVQKRIISGINFLLDNTDLDFVIPCHSGNHGRITKKQRHSTESGNSLEYIMYHNIADHFSDNPRVKFMISRGYHSFIDVEGFVIRFHHGHDIRYAGGVGGIFIPAYKAIAQWQKSRAVNLDVFGHFHQLKYGGNFVCNGSLIGYNAYALSIKADFERPQQAFFLINHQRKQLTDLSPIWLEDLNDVH